MVRLKLSNTITLEFEDERVYFINRNAEDQPESYFKPDNFGGLLWLFNKNYQLIDDFFEENIRNLAHFKYSFEAMESILDYEAHEEYLDEEFGRGKISNEVVRLLAEAYTAAFPFVTLRKLSSSQKSFSENFFLYDGFYGLPENTYPDPLILASIDLKDFTTNIFNSYRKDLAKLVAHMDFETIAIVSSFRNIVDLNHIKNQLELTSSIKITDYVDLHNLDILNILSEASRLRLFKDTMTNPDETVYLINDSIDMLSTVQHLSHEFKQIKGWVDLHNRVMTLAPEVDEKLKVEPPAALFNIHDESLDNLKFELITHGSDFIKIGEILTICLGRSNYLSKSLRDESFCVAISKNDKIYGVMEIGYESRQKKWRVLQLKGAENKDLQEDESIREFVLKNINKDEKFTVIAKDRELTLA